MTTEDIRAKLEELSIELDKHITALEQKIADQPFKSNEDEEDELDMLETARDCCDMAAQQL